MSMDRDDEENVHHQFEAVVGQYGQMESVMGADGYKAFVDARQAERDGIKAHGDKITAVAQMVRVITLVGFLAAIPLIVLLWKVAIEW